MSNRNLTNILCLCPLLLNMSCTQRDSEAERPNILFIMADDHTAQAFGIYGSRLAGLNPTPTLDSLAAQGIIFDHCYATNSICTPSRASILTGQYSQTNGVLDLEGELSAEKQYLPLELSKLGYQTAIIGKWHLEAEPAAFDEYVVLPGQGDYFDPTFQVKGEAPWPKSTIKRKGHSTDVITDLTINWLENERDKSKPFFLMHHFKAPHDMFEFAPRYQEYLEDVEIPEPESLYERGKGSVATRGAGDALIHEIGSSVSHRNPTRNMGQHMGIDADTDDPEYTHLAYQEYLKRYLRCVKGVDDNMKRLLKTLEKEDLLENTIIVYTSDQGFMLGEHDLIDKRWMYEESMKMPLFISHQGRIKPGMRTDALVNNTDFAPTLLELAGGKVPGYMQGNSFKAILETGQEPEDWPQSVYYRYWMHMAHKHAVPAHFGIRTKKYKLLFFYGKYYVDTDATDNWNKQSWGNRFDFHTPPAWEFYDLEKDPFEMHNRYKDPDYADIIAGLKDQLKQQRKTLNEEDDNYPHIQKIIDEHW